MGALAAGERHRAKGYPRLVTAGAYAMLVLACFLAGYLLIPLPGEEPRSGASIERIRLPEPGIIKVQVVNDGPHAVTIPQVLVEALVHAQRELCMVNALDLGTWSRERRVIFKAGVVRLAGRELIGLTRRALREAWREPF